MPDLSNLHQLIGYSLAIREYAAERYQAIRTEAEDKGHDVVSVEGDPQGFGLRVSRNVSGFSTTAQSEARVRVAEWNEEMSGLATVFANEVANSRWITAEINRLEQEGQS